MEGLSYTEFPNICRICLGRQDLIHIREVEWVFDAFKNITSVQIEELDELPHSFCCNCVEQVKDIINFIDKSKQNDTILKQILLKTKLKPEKKGNHYNSATPVNIASSSGNESEISITEEILDIKMEPSTDMQYEDDDILIEESNMAKLKFEQEEKEEMESLKMHQPKDLRPAKMSRGRKRKSQKGLFSEECMRRAVRQVLIGEGGVKLSLRKAAEENGLSFQTLQRYVKKEREKTDPNMQISMKSQYKHRLVFTDNEERALVDYVNICSKMCYGQTTKDTRELAYEMAKINQKRIPLSWEINKLAGIDWFQGFLKRHSKLLSIGQPEGCSLSRASSFNEHNVKLFFDNLKKAYERSEAFSDGTRIYNLGEMGTMTKKVLSAKGVEQVSQCTSGEREVLITTCCIISASGNTLPPVMVFPQKKFKSHMLNGAPSGTLSLATSTAWMNGEIFPSVMKHFIKYSGSSKENPTILIFDNHESHLTIETLNIAKDNGVTIITIPPHCSHKLQPLDVSIFAPLKAYFNSAVDSWLLHHPGIPLSIYEVAGCVGVAFERSMTPFNIKAGFKKTGIFPFDRETFTTDDFLSSSVTDRDVLNDSALYTADGLTASTTMDISPVIEDFTEEIPSTSVETSYFIQIPSTSLNTPQVTDNPAEDKPATSATTVFVSPQILKRYTKAGQRKLQKSNQLNMR